jgi:hypothetical protein
MTERKASTKATAKANAGISPLRVRKRRERFGRDDNSLLTRKLVEMTMLC